MARFPNIFGDKDNWGDVLLEFLGISHNEDGSLKSDAVGAAVGDAIEDALADNQTVVDAASQAAAAAVDDEISVRGLVSGESTVDSEVHHGFADKDGRASWLTGTPSGLIPTHAQQIITEAVAALLGEYRDGIPEPMPDGTGWLFAIVDQDDRIAFGIRNNGEVYPDATTDVIDAPQPAPVETLLGVDRGLKIRTPNAGVRPYTSTPDRVAFWGDSLTEGWPIPPFEGDGSNSLPGVFATLHTSGDVLNGGYAGKVSDEIAIWQGGLIIEVVPVGGVIPAGDAPGENDSVTMTTEQTPRWRLSSPSGFSVPGTVAGVAGQLTRVDATTFTFTRSEAGNPVDVPEPVPFMSTVGEGYFDAVTILFAGRNDVSYFWDEDDCVDRVEAAYVAMVESLTPVHPRFLVLGTLTATTEAEGSSRHTVVTEINRRLQLRYPDNFFDLRRWLIDDALAAMEITPTTSDLNNIANDTLPPSLMHDSVHYTPETAAAIAQRLYDELTQRGWI